MNKFREIENCETVELELTGTDNFVIVHLHNIAPSKGVITIVHKDNAWTARWDGMGNKLIDEFFIEQGTGHATAHLTNCMSPTIDNFEAMRAELMAKLTSLQATDDEFLAEELEDELGKELNRDWCFRNEELLKACFGDEFYYEEQIPKKACSEYQSLYALFKQVQDGLKNYIKAKSERARLRMCGQLLKASGDLLKSPIDLDLPLEMAPIEGELDCSPNDSVCAEGRIMSKAELEQWAQKQGYIGCNREGIDTQRKDSE